MAIVLLVEDDGHDSEHVQGLDSELFELPQDLPAVVLEHEGAEVGVCELGDILADSVESCENVAHDKPRAKCYYSMCYALLGNTPLSQETRTNELPWTELRCNRPHARLHINLEVRCNRNA